MKKGTPAVLVLMLGAAGATRCASTTDQEPKTASPESITMHAPSGVLQATVDGSRIFGPGVELTRDGTSLRGHGPTGVVDLRAENGSIRGTAGQGPTELCLEPVPEGGFLLRGLFNSSLGNLEVRPDRIQGQVGRCQYSLRGSACEGGSAYSGQRICGRGMEPTALTLSPSIAALDPLERGAFIAVWLGR